MLDIVEVILSKKWEYSSDRRMTYQKMRLFNYAYQHDLPKRFGVPSVCELYRVKDFSVSQYHGLDEYTTAFKKIEREFNGEGASKLFKILTKFIKRFEKSFAVYVEKMPFSYNSYGDEKLLKAYLDYCEVEENISFPTLLLFFPFEETITKVLRRVLEKKLRSQAKADKIIKDISLPDKITPLDFYNKTLYEIALAPKLKRGALLSEFKRKFIHWGMWDVIYPEASREHFFKKLAEVENFDAQKLLIEINEKYKLRAKKRNAVMKSLADNNYICQLLNLFSHYANYKDWKNYYREKSSYKLKILLKDISKRIGLSLEETAFLTEEETRRALRGQVSLNPEEIDQRSKNSAFVFLDDRVYIITDAGTLSKIDKIITPAEKAEIKGVGAYPGKVKGLARLIVSGGDISKFKAGDILVTSTTRPDYAPIMEKAAGFVTNEGGLLSHAAITAREFKKPCVIGTKIATKVLHDGDLVEVDADKGVVRILKKA